MAFSHHIKSALKIGVAGGLIWWLVEKGMLDLSVLQLILSPVYLPLCLLIVALNITFATLRWYRLLRAGGVPVKLTEVAKFNLIGIFFNFAMPGGVGGDVVKGYYIVKDQKEKRAAAAASIIADRVFGLFTMVLMATTVVLLNLDMAEQNMQLGLLFSGVGVLLFGFVGVGLVLYSRRIRSFITGILSRYRIGQLVEKLYVSLQGFARDFHLMGTTILLSFLAHGCVVALFMVVATAMNVPNIGLTSYFFVIPLGLIAMAAPISPAGIGVGQAAFLVLFNTYSGTKTTLGADGLTIFQVCLLLYGLIGAFFYVGYKGKMSEVPDG